MTRFATVGLGTAERWDAAVDAALEACAWRERPPDVGFLYLTDRFHPEVELIRSRVVVRSGVRVLTGTVAVGLHADGREIFDEPAVAVLFLWLDDVTSEAVVAQGPVALDGPSGGAGLVVHVDSGQTGGLLTYAQGRPVPVLAGGVSSSRMGSVQLHAGGSVFGGLTGVHFGPGLPVRVAVAQGCAPLGPVHRITRSLENVIVELDGRRALEVLREDVGELMSRDLRRAAQRILVARHLPKGREAEYTVRHLMGLDLDRGLIAIGDRAWVNEQVHFARRDPASAEDDLRARLQALRDELGAPPVAVLYFSCLGRGPSLFGEAGAESAIVRDVLGDVPLVGFFCNGELAGEQLYGYTGVAVAIG